MSLTTVKTAISDKIAALTTADSNTDIGILSKIAKKLGLSNSNALTVAGTKSDTVTSANSSVDLALLATTLLDTSDKPVMIGEVVQLSPDFPPRIEIDGMSFVKNGYAVQSGYDPALEPYKNIVVGFETLTNNDFYDAKAVDICQGVIIVVGANGLVLRSMDDGITWTKLTAFAPTAIFDVISVMGDTILISNSNASMSAKPIWKSTDKGLTWQQLNSASFTGGQSCKSIKNNGAVWFLITTAGMSTANALLRSTDNGVTWVTMATTFSFPASVMSSIAVIGDIVVIALDQQNSTLYISMDSGLSWGTISCVVSGTSYSNRHISAVGDFFLFHGGNDTYFYPNEMVFRLCNNFTSNTENDLMAVVGNTLYVGSGTSLYAVPVSSISANLDARGTIMSINYASNVNNLDGRLYVTQTNSTGLVRSKNAVGLMDSNLNDSHYMRYK